MAGSSELELVTGYRGKAHVTADDARSYNAGTIGKGTYVLPEGGEMAAEMVDSNTLRIQSGTLLAQGCQCRVRAGEYVDVKIRNGSQAMKRNDIVVARYEKQAAEPRTESMTLKVIEGTPTDGKAKDPDHVEGDILAGDLVAEFPLWRVPLDGITVGTPVPLYKKLVTLESVGESVSQAKNALIKTEDTDVAGYAGRISVRHDGFGTSSSPHGFVSDEETFVQVTGFLWTDNEQTGAWPALVKAPWQPDDLKDHWCVKVPVKVAKEGAVNVAHRSHVDVGCVLYIETTGGGSFAYSGTTTKRLFSSTDGCLYIALHKEKPAGLPAILYVDATIPLAGL